MPTILVATRDGVHVFDAEGQPRAVAHFVVEGEVFGLDDEAALRRVIDAYGATMQRPLEIRDGGVFGPNAPTAGAPPYAVFRSRREPSSVYPASPGWSRRKARDRSAPTRWGFSDDG